MHIRRFILAGRYLTEYVEYYSKVVVEYSIRIRVIILIGRFIAHTYAFNTINHV